MPSTALDAKFRRLERVVAQLQRRVESLEGPKLEPSLKCQLCGQVAGYHDPDCLGAAER